MSLAFLSADYDGPACVSSLELGQGNELALPVVVLAFGRVVHVEAFEAILSLLFVNDEGQVAAVLLPEEDLLPESLLERLEPRSDRNHDEAAVLEGIGNLVGSELTCLSVEAQALNEFNEASVTPAVLVGVGAEFFSLGYELVSAELVLEKVLGCHLDAEDATTGNHPVLGVIVALEAKLVPLTQVPVLGMKGNRWEVVAHALSIHLGKQAQTWLCSKAWG